MESVVDIAKRWVKSAGHSEYWDCYEDIVEAISRAVEEERMRCVAIADSWITPLNEDVEYGSDYWMAHMNVVSCAEHISKAIMDGDNTSQSDISRKTV